MEAYEYHCTTFFIKDAFFQCCGSGSGIRDEQPGSYFLELRNHFFGFFGVKIRNFFDEDPGTEMETVRIRDGKKSDPGSGINIPDPQHCIFQLFVHQKHASETHLDPHHHICRIGVGGFPAALFFLADITMVQP
jgi:hypothetical protein